MISETISAFISKWHFQAFVANIGFLELGILDLDFGLRKVGLWTVHQSALWYDSQKISNRMSAGYTTPPTLSKEYGLVIIPYWALLYSKCPRSFVGILGLDLELRKIGLWTVPQMRTPHSVINDSNKHLKWTYWLCAEMWCTHLGQEIPE